MDMLLSIGVSKPTLNKMKHIAQQEDGRISPILELSRGLAPDKIIHRIILDTGFAIRNAGTGKEISEVIEDFIISNGFKKVLNLDAIYCYNTNGTPSQEGPNNTVYVKTEGMWFWEKVVAILDLDWQSTSEKIINYSNTSLYTTDEGLINALELSLKPHMFHRKVYKPTPERRIARVGLLIQTMHGLKAMFYELPHRDIDHTYYEKGVVDKLINVLKTPGPGLIFLPGDAGTGKTTLIRWLTTEVTDRQFMYLPHSQLGSLQSMGSLEGMISTLKNAVLILEDAEGLFKSRDGKSENGLSSTLLNLTDGLLGEMINCKVIVTQNTIGDIDPAFLRSGRLLFKHEFKALPAAQAVEVAKKLGKNEDIIVSITEPMVLSDIFALPGGVAGQALSVNTESIDALVNTEAANDLETEEEIEEEQEETEEDESVVVEGEVYFGEPELEEEEETTRPINLDEQL